MTDVASRFESCLAEVLRHEGGYADHPSDPGGATNMGITRKTLARWRKVTPWWKLDKTAVRRLDRSEAARIYRALYWQASRAGHLPAGLDLTLFDFAVNSGAATAVKSLQRELKVKADGLFGPISLAALKQRIALAGAGAMIDALADRRLGFLQRLSAHAVFGRGWSARVMAVRAAAHAAAGTHSQPSPTQDRRHDMTFLSGFKTYIIAGIMILVALAQVMGLDLPSFDGQSAGQLAMEAFAIIFLRRGIKTEIGNA